MISSSILFHVAAAIGCIWLSYGAVRWRVQRNFLRRWLSPSRPAVYVSEPIHGLKVFCHALGIHLEVSMPSSLSPTRISFASLFAMHARCGIHNVVVSENAGIEVVFYLSKVEGTIVEYQRHIENDFANCMHVRLVPLG